MSAEEIPTVPEELSGLSWPAKALYRELVVRGPLTRAEAAENLGCPPNDLWRPIARLRRAGVLTEENNADDLRKQVYDIESSGSPSPP